MRTDDLDIRQSRITLVGSPDVLATIGRSGLLDTRAEIDEVDRVDSLRSDELLARLNNKELEPGRVLITSLYPDLFAGGDALDRTVANLAAVASVMSEHKGQLFVFNVSTYDPADTVHRYGSEADGFAVRTQRLLMDLENKAGKAGINVIDVDAAVAEVGGIETVPQRGALSGAAIDFVTDEAILAIDQTGALAGSIQAPVMRLVVPSFDRRTSVGAISKWHVAQGAMVSEGDPLFDVRFESRVHRFDLEDGDKSAKGRKAGKSNKAQRFWNFDITVVAGADAYLNRVLVEESGRVTAGDTAAVMTTGRGMNVSASDAAADFRVGVRVME